MPLVAPAEKVLNRGLDNVYIKPVLRDLIDNIESDNEYVA